MLNPPDGEDPRAWVAAVVAAEVAGLREAKEALAGSDARERAAAALGLAAELPRPLSLLRRYEATCHRRMQWALKQLRHGRHSTPHVEPAPAVASPVAPASPPAPFDARLLPEVDADLLAMATLDAEIAELGRQVEAMAPGFLSDPALDPDPDPAPSSPSSLPDPFTDILLDPSPTRPKGGNRPRPAGGPPSPARERLSDPRRSPGHPRSSRLGVIVRPGPDQGTARTGRFSLISGASVPPASGLLPGRSTPSLSANPANRSCPGAPTMITDEGPRVRRRRAEQKPLVTSVICRVRHWSLKPRPLAVRPEELRAIRRAF